MTLKNKLLSKFNMGDVSKNVSWILIQNIFSMICSVFVTAIVARHYGAAGYGYINFAQSFVALFSFIAIMGTNHIIMKNLRMKVHGNILMYIWGIFLLMVYRNGIKLPAKNCLKRLFYVVQIHYAAYTARNSILLQSANRLGRCLP